MTKTNKNKFIIVANAINMLMLSVLLNGCTGTDINNMNEGNNKRSSGMNGSASKQAHTSNDPVSSVAICSCCGQGAIFLYQLADKQRSVIGICKECEAPYPNPENLTSSGTVTDEKLATMLGISNPEDLFKNSDWAKKEDVENGKWESW